MPSTSGSDRVVTFPHEPAEQNKISILVTFGSDIVTTFPHEFNEQNKLMDPDIGNDIEVKF